MLTNLSVSYTLVQAFSVIVKTDGSSAALVESLQCECDAMSGSHKTGPLLGPGGGQRLESAGLCHQLDSHHNCQVTLTLGPAQLADLFLLHFAGCIKPYSDKKQYISLEDDSYF